MSDAPTITTETKPVDDCIGFDITDTLQDYASYNTVFQLNGNFLTVNFKKINNATVYEFTFFHCYPVDDVNAFSIFTKQLQNIYKILNKQESKTETDELEPLEFSTLDEIFKKYVNNKTIFTDDLYYFKNTLKKGFEFDIDKHGLYLPSIQGGENDKSKKLDEYIVLYNILIKSNKWFGNLTSNQGLTGSEARYKHSLIF